MTHYSEVDHRGIAVWLAEEQGRYEVEVMTANSGLHLFEAYSLEGLRSVERAIQSAIRFCDELLQDIRLVETGERVSLPTTTDRFAPDEPGEWRSAARWFGEFRSRFVDRFKGGHYLNGYGDLACRRVSESVQHRKDFFERLQRDVANRIEQGEASEILTTSN